MKRSIQLLFALFFMASTALADVSQYEINEDTGTVYPSAVPLCLNDETVMCLVDSCGSEGKKLVKMYIPKGAKMPPNCSKASTIINNSFEYFGESTDFRIGNTPSGCGSCSGGVSSGNILPSVGVTRLLRPRYANWQEGDLQASFGKANYWKEVDKTIRIEASGQILVNDPKDIDQSVYAVFNATRGAWIDVENAYFQSISLFDVNGALINAHANNTDARTAIKLLNDGTTEHYEIYWFPGSQKQGASQARAVGRLTAIMDRSGNAIQVSYQHPVRADGLVADEGDAQLWDKYAELWKKDTVTDAYGRQIKCHYEMQDYRYVINRLELPNSQEITYGYGTWIWWGGRLTSVNHPDGSSSSWTLSQAGSGLMKITQSDRSASRTEQHKHVYITHHWGKNAAGAWVRQPPYLVRRVDNGANEVKYANNFVVAADNTVYSFIREGGNRIYKGIYNRKGGATTASYVTDPALKNDFYFADLALSASTAKIGDSTYDTRSSRTAGAGALGRSFQVVRNPLDNTILSGVAVDGSTSSTTYNSFSQPLVETDRLGRVTASVYDVFGNLLSKTQGVGTADETTFTYVYNSRGQVIESRDALYDANTPELHNTQFEYNTAGYLIKKIESADIAGGTRPESLFTYDTAGRITSSTDPLGRTSSYTYDSRDRVIETTYNDTSTQLVEYGTGDESNLVISRTDRNGIKTTFSYDSANRVSQTQTLNSQSQVIGETNTTYLEGTSQKLTQTNNGETTSYVYDYANRLIETKIQADANTVLASTSEIDQLGRTRSTTDAYGRSTYYLYDQNDNVIKTIAETVPGGLTNVPAIVPSSSQTSSAQTYTLTDKTGNTLSTADTHKVTYTDPRDLYLDGLTRDLSPNAKFLITETVYDAEGQSLIQTDARGNSSWTEYDTLGRTTLSIQAVGTPSEIRSEQDYDDNSNVVETRSPRHFEEGPGTTANLTGVGKDSYEYNGRNMRSSHITAVGSPEAQTQSWTYLLDGRSDEHTDFRGNVAKSIWHTCCGRLQATIERDGTSTTIHNTDYNGNPTHTATVSNFQSQISNPYNWHNPIDNETLREITTRFDGRGRPTHTTVWLQPLGNVVDHARVSLGDAAGIPIAGLDGIPATDGLTTSYVYDEDLTDGVGIDSTYSTQLAELTTRYGYNPFGADSDGYAVAVTNPAGETSVQISDGAGRTILTINPEGNIATMHYDEMVNVALALPLNTNYSLLSTKSIDALDNENVSYSDGAGRTLASKDAEGNFSYAAYNANSSVVTNRDANGLGQTCEYDALNRPTTCADLQETAEGNTRTTTYNAASQTLTSTNADGETTTNVYDVRSRLASTTDANNIVTDYTYDANNNLVTLSDGKGNLRHWFFDARNLNTTKVHQGNAADAASSSDFYTQNFDALGRVSIKVDQIGTTVTMHYDLAGRLTSKDYHTGATPAQGGTVTPGGTLESTDTFSYDAAGRLTATTKGRHNISTEHTYAADSMPLTEKLVADGRSYESTRTYDAANRPLTHTFPNGKSTSWAYTARNLVASIHYEDKLVAGQNYDAGYRLTSQTLGNGLVRTISYGRQDNLRTADSVAGKQDLQMTYSYAADKQITAETIAEDVLSNTSFTASYDAGNRITNWNRAGAPVNNAQSWNYDDNGNWISTTKDGTTEARNHNNTDQLTQIAGNAATNDAKGNLTEYEINGKEYEVDYDLDNRIIKVDVDNDDVEYRYDALGRRVIRQEGTTKTALIWWGNSENAEHKHQAGQTVIQNDIMAHPSRLNSVIARAVDGSKFKLEWYHKNYLDHVYAVSKDNGDILEHYRYTAFGEVTIYNASGNQVATTQIDNHILWNTRRRDELTGYYMYKFRHYSAELGRWPSRDPIEEDGGVNLYGFVENDPVGRWDELGLRIRKIGSTAIWLVRKYVTHIALGGEPRNDWYIAGKSRTVADINVTKTNVNFVGARQFDSRPKKLKRGGRFFSTWFHMISGASGGEISCPCLDDSGEEVEEDTWGGTRIYFKHVLSESEAATLGVGVGPISVGFNGATKYSIHEEIIDICPDGKGGYIKKNYVRDDDILDDYHHLLKP